MAITNSFVAPSILLKSAPFGALDTVVDRDGGVVALQGDLPDVFTDAIGNLIRPDELGSAEHRASGRADGIDSEAPVLGATGAEASATSGNFLPAATQDSAVQSVEQFVFEGPTAVATAPPIAVDFGLHAPLAAVVYGEAIKAGVASHGTQDGSLSANQVATVMPDTELTGDAVDAPGAPGTLQTLANYLRVGFWNDFLGGASQRYYNLTGSGTGPNSGTLFYNVTWSPDDSNGISAARAVMVREAFNIYESVLGINFVETTSTTDPVDFFFGDNVADRAYCYSIMHSGNSGAINYSVVNVDSAWYGGSSTIGDYSFQTFIHEIGHGLGLGHQGNYNAGAGSPTYANSAQWENDSWALTMMSYWDQSENTSASTSGYTYAQLVSPMTVDWIALNDLYAGQGYGVANAFTGNTVWGFGTNISAATSAAFNGLAGFADSNAFTIVDGGGVDTINFSNYGVNQVINLNAASTGATNANFSSVGGYTANMSIAAGTIIENAVSGSGNDVLIGNTAHNTLLGNAGNDWLVGDWGDDTIYGGTGNDTIYGGFDVDTVYGEDGNDLIFFEAGPFFDNVDGGTGEDTLDATAVTSSGYIFNFQAGTITGHPSVQTLANVEIFRGGSGNDIVISDGSGQYYGNAGNDTMTAGLGTAETIDGGAGTDTLDTTPWGGNYVINMVTGVTNYPPELFTNFENVVTGAGNDSITGTAGNNSIATGTGNDTINGGGGSDTVDAGAGDDLVIDAHSSPGDVFDGGAGIDTLVADFTWNTGVTYDLTAGWMRFSGSGGTTYDTILNFENLTAGGAADVTGTAAANIITITDTGSLHNNTINTLEGNDSITSGLGNDTINAGSGNDTVLAGDNDDTITDTEGMGSSDDDVYNGGAGIDTLVHNLNWVSSVAFDLTTGFSSYGGNRDQLIGIENLTVGGSASVRGDALANVLIVNGTGANVINGEAGSDTIDAGGGNDTINAGSGNDSVIAGDGDDIITDTEGMGATDDDVYNGGAGIDTLVHNLNWVSTVAFDLTAGFSSFGGNRDQLIGIENLTVGGSASVRGDALANVLIVNGTGANVINGEAGNDTIDGGGGNDTINAGLGNDSVIAGDGDDTIIDTSTIFSTGQEDDVYNGGAGIDTLVHDLNWVSSVAFDLTTGFTTFGGNRDQLIGIENLTVGGSASVRGSAVANVLIVNGIGANVINGEAGNDTIVAGGGNDTINAGSGLDSVLAGDGDDIVDGGSGNDTLAGGLGNDQYTVNSALDVVVENAGEGTDLVFSSAAAYTLAANVENLTLKGSANLNGTGNILANIVKGNDGDNVILGMGGDDSLVGGDGNDNLDGGGLNDTLLGGSGNDSLFGGGGDDSLVGGAGNDSLKGGSDGFDTLKGGAGNDDYEGVDAADVLTESANQGYDRVFSNVSFTLGNNFEYLELTSGSAATGTGNTLGNTLIGNSNNNILSGLGGADVLYGEGGNDSLDAGADAVEDQFVFDTALNAATNVDTLFNAQFGEDQVLLDNDIFGALLSNGGTDEGTLAAAYYFEGAGSSGGGLNSGIGVWYNLTSGGLYYNPTANVAGDSILFAIVNGASATLSNTDFTLFTDVG